MAKPTIVKPNITGNKYMCVGLKEDPEGIELWSDGFTIGKIYYECKIDSDGNNLIKTVDNILLLIDDNQNTIYVDSTQFVKTENTNKIVTNMWISLN